MLNLHIFGINQSSNILALFGFIVVFSSVLCIVARCKQPFLEDPLGCVRIVLSSGAMFVPPDPTGALFQHLVITLFSACNLIICQRVQRLSNNIKLLIASSIDDSATFGSSAKNLSYVIPSATTMATLQAQIICAISNLSGIDFFINIQLIDALKIRRHG